MDVSHFELVYKPQSPVPPADTVLQGYFLKISNLEDRSYEYRLEFVTSSITDADRSLFGNTLVFVDVPGVDNQSGVFSLNGAPDAASFRLNRSIRIPAHGTALVALLPSDPVSMPGGPPVTANFECRGYVKLTLPVVFRRAPRGSGRFFVETAQAEGPVKVMLTPQNRATYLSPEGVINDQTQASVPVATGQAVNDLQPDQPNGLLSELTLADDPTTNLPEDLTLNGTILAGVMAKVAADKDGWSRFNALMAEAGIDLALENRVLAKARDKTDA